MRTEIKYKTAVLRIHFILRGSGSWIRTEKMDPDPGSALEKWIRIQVMNIEHFLKIYYFF